MPRTPQRAAPLAQRLLDAQVAYHCERLTGERLAPTVAGLVDRLLATGEGHQLEDLVDREALTGVVARALRTVPPSAAAGALVEMLATALHDGPGEPVSLAQLVDRDRFEACLDSLVALHPVAEHAVDGLADVPLVGTVATRFMGRVVGEVLQANRTVTDRVPGLGSLMSFGTSAASRVVGAADRQLEGLIGETMGRGGAFAVRRLNGIVVETLRDPTTREAALQAWDLLAEELVVGLGPRATMEQVHAAADAWHALAIGILADEPAARLAASVVDGLLDRFGGYAPTELLAELDLTRDDLVADLVALAPPVLDALRESGDLERLVRAELEPFFASDEVADLLG